MEHPRPKPTSEKLPKRVDGTPYSDDALAFDPEAGWQRGCYQYDSETGTTGAWEFNGEVVDTADVTHWMPMPPDPPV